MSHGPSATLESQREKHSDQWLNNVTIDTIPTEGQRLLRDYSGIKQDEILAHVLAVRDKGFVIAPFNCVGAIKFLGNRFPKVPYFDRYVAKLRQGVTFLDVGCGLGQELRYLVEDQKINPSQLHGFDLEQAFIDLGFDLFRDRDRFKAGMFQADMMKPIGSQPALDQLNGSMDLIQVAQVFHVFDWDDMIKAAVRLVKLARAQPGTMIAGTQMGSSNAGSYGMPQGTAPTGKNYRHNPESMSKFWDEVGSMTDSRWSVDCGEIYSETKEQVKNAWWAKNDPGLYMIYFCATRL